MSNSTDPATRLPAYTLQELAKHNKVDDAWISINGFVYDITDFADGHPGGTGVILRYAGKECTQEYNQHHGELVMLKYHEKLVIGTLDAPKTPKESRLTKLAQSFGPVPLPNIFGDLIPWGDPTWYQGWVSPYYKESHRKFREMVREFVNKEVIPYVHKWDEAKSMPKEFLQKCAETGLLPVVVGPPWPTEYCSFPPTAGMKPEEFDHFHSTN